MTQGEPRDPDDPKGLIRESYRIDGIGEGECRSILVDWALSLPADTDPGAALDRLARRYAETAPAHPMSGLLQTPQGDLPAPTRRGGAAGRRRDPD